MLRAVPNPPLRASRRAPTQLAVSAALVAALLGLLGGRRALLSPGGTLHPETTPGPGGCPCFASSFRRVLATSPRPVNS
jgi:hypothetical protein